MTSANKSFGKSLTCAMFASLALAIGCGGGGGSSTSKTTTTTIATPTQNVQTITVDGGPTAFLALGEGSYVNGAFVTVTVCAPGTATCQQIDHVLVDTGSVGLRILSSSSGGEFTVALPATSVGGNPLGECVQFADGTFLWGPVETADVKIAGETASSVPVNVVGDTTFNASAPLPQSCGTPGPNDDDTLGTLGANGILGVGTFQQDCGGLCVTGTPPNGVYYQCPSSGCVPSLVSAAQQVQNPVGLFATDNNGVIVELPASSGPQASISGSLVFGIGTQSNNALGSATVLTINPNYGYFTTKFNGSTMSSSFIDSGSNGLFFDDSSIAQCQTATGFYCPLTPVNNLSAVNTGANGATSTVTFSVVNAETTFNANPNDAVIPGLAANNGSFASFDFGLPFFYGRNVFTSIQGTTAPGGSTPYWAY